MDDRIPIQNVYYLLCYAWRKMRSGEIAETGVANQTTLVDLFAKVLINGTERLLKQGLDRGYVTQSEDTSRPRGRIDFETSLKRALLPRARVHCRYDELSRDVLHNRILKSTLEHLARAEGINEKHRSRLLALQKRFGDVGDAPLRRSLFQRLQLHSNNAFYRFLLDVCSMVEQHLLPKEDGTGRRFRNFLREEATMSDIFEKFVLNFYKREQDAYKARAPHIYWDLSGSSPDRLPRMETDAALISPDRTIIIDAKFYEDPLTTHRGTERYRSGHLYQLFAYLRNAKTKGKAYEHPEGILLYGQTDTDLDASFVIQGHQIRVYSLDLDQEWRGIHEDLLSLAE